MAKTYNDALEWAAQWIEDTLKNGPETHERTVEFGTNMAMTLRAAKLPDADLPRATEGKLTPLSDEEIRLLTDHHYYEAEKAITRRGDSAAQQRHLERLGELRTWAKSRDKGEKS